MSASSVYPLVGYPAVNPWQLQDTTSEIRTGTIMTFVDPYWGPLECIYGYATASIRQFGLVSYLPSVQSNAMRIDMTEVPNTANLGVPLAVAMVAMTVGQYGWFVIGGITPVNCTASVAANTAFGIVAAGQGGALAAGKQIVNGRSALAATATVVKANCTANSGSLILNVPNADGWFVGAYLSGTGIAAATTVVSIDPSGTQVVLSLVTTAAVAGSVTATYNNATVFYNIAVLDRPFAQGAIT